MHEIEKLIKERETVDAIVKTVCMVLKVKEKDFKTKIKFKLCTPQIEFSNLEATTSYQIIEPEKTL